MGAPSSKFFQTARARISAEGTVRRQTRNESARAGMDQLGLLYGSLASTGTRASGILSADNQRRVAALNRIATKGATQARATVQGAQAGNTARYGSALGRLSSQQLKPAKAQAGEVAGVGKATAVAGKNVARAGNQAMDIIAAGNVASRNSADYAMASALMYRAKDDASLIAGERTQLAQTRLSFAHDVEMAKLNAKIAADAAAKAAKDAQDKLDKASLGALGQVTSMLPNVGVDLANFLGGDPANVPPALDQNGQPMQDADGKLIPAWTGIPSTAQIAAYAAQNAGISTDSPLFPLILQTAQLMKSGASAQEAIAQAMQTAYGGLDGYDSASVTKALQTAFVSSLHGSAVAAITGGDQGGNDTQNWQGRTPGHTHQDFYGTVVPDDGYKWNADQSGVVKA